MLFRIVIIWLSLTLPETVKGSCYCGGNYTRSSGVLLSPNYPSKYPNDCQCSYIIRRSSGNGISLTFSSFDLEGCKYDNLTVRSGCYSSSPVLGIFCGSKVPCIIIQSQSSCLYLTFQTDGSVQHSGFYATYRSNFDSTVCPNPNCNRLDSPAHGYLSTTNSYHGTSVTVSCHSGYTLAGESSLSCSSGFWTGTVGTCEADCKHLMIPANGSVSSLNTTHGTVVEIVCDSGFTLVGERLIRCFSGSWTASIGVCEPVPISRVVIKDGKTQLSNFALINVTEGSPKTLECTVDKTVLVTYFMWYIGTELQQNDTNGTFTFRPETNDHDKFVFCKAYHKEFLHLAIESVSPRLNVFGRPACPRTFILTNSMGANASFYWISGYNGGHEQWFTIQYRGREALDWTNSSRIEEATPNPDNSFIENTAEIPIPNLGEFQARIVAENIIGEAMPLYLKSKIIPNGFLRQSQTTDKESKNPSLALIIGTVTGAVILVLLGVITFQQRSKLKPKKDRRTVFVALDETQKAQRNLENCYEHISSLDKTEQKGVEAFGHQEGATAPKHANTQELKVGKANTHEDINSSENHLEDYEHVCYPGSNPISTKYGHNQEIEIAEEPYENLQIGATGH